MTDPQQTENTTNEATIAVGRRAGSHVTLYIGLIAGLAALAVRLWRLDLMLFDFDEGIASIFSLQLLWRGSVPLVGVKTSLGFYNPPLFVFLISIPYAFSKSPLAATAFLQCLGAAAIACLCIYLRHLRWRAGLALVAVVAALSPGPLLLCWRLWGHALIPVFSIAAFLATVVILRIPNCRWASLLLPIAISFAQQVHFSGALLLFSAGLTLTLYKARPSWKWLAMGGAIALLSYTPYLFHMVDTGFRDVGIIVDLITTGVPKQESHRPLYLAALNSLTDFGTNTALQENYGKLLQTLPLFVATNAVGAFCLTASIGWFLFRLVRRRSLEPITAAALIWMAVPFAAFSLLHITVVPAYWLVALPGPWLVCGAAAEAIADSRFARITRPAMALMLGLFVMACATYFISYHAVLLSGDASMQQYPSYRDQRNAIRHIVASSAGRPAVIRQDIRTLKGGVDYQLFYLLALFEPKTQRFSPTDLETKKVCYSIINRARPLPPQIVAALKSMRATRFGLLNVYEEPMPAAIR